jgi:hypothetical protein
MTKEEIEKLTEIEIKRLQGIFELDMYDWSRKYDFIDWKN